ncbi:WXG100 family type VII secretion target [Streptacidiphilus sp. ASG 303]|nr:WXG100 family type VII secretion target [Streptacidiphilus sp. ASG 303]MCD0484102.1 WXG100 family type VII secretion target [Streptacidiphilus sp. ASG 303]
MPKNQEHTGFNEGENGGLFGDPTYGNFSVSDYDTWDWKQIRAAIVGMAAGDMSKGENATRALGVANPQSLQEAANAFYKVQQTLEVVAKSLEEQAKALAGENGPWKGEAAESFANMATTFSRQVQANADALSGGSTKLNSVPQQLADNASSLSRAQSLIVQIDQHYAAWALKNGASTGADGLVTISKKPQIVEMMTRDMRAVLKSLAHEYQVTIDSVVAPPPIPPPNRNSPGGDGNNDKNGINGLGNNTDLGGSGGKGNDGPPPPFSNNLSTGGGGGDLGGAGSPPPFPKSLSTKGDGIGADGGLGGGDGIGGLGGSGAPPPFPGDLSTGAGAGGDGIGGGSLDPGALDSALNPDSSGLGGPPPYTGSTDTGGDTGVLPPGLGGPLGFSGGTGTSGSGSLSDAGNLLSTDPSAWGEAGSPLPFGGGADVGAAGAGLSTGEAAGFPGDLSTESGLPSSFGSSGLAGEGGATSLGGMPYLPGMGGMGGAAAGGAQAGERPDASGLLESSTEPWTGGVGVGDEAGSAVTAPHGGEGLDLGTPAQSVLAPGEESATGVTAAGAPLGGMPYLPGMGGMGGAAAGGAQAGERPDASGLLEPSTEPWTDESETDVHEGEEALTSAAASGGAGLLFAPLAGGLAGPVGGPGATAASRGPQPSGERAGHSRESVPPGREGPPGPGLPWPTGTSAAAAGAPGPAASADGGPASRHTDGRTDAAPGGADGAAVLPRTAGGAVASAGPSGPEGAGSGRDGAASSGGSAEARGAAARTAPDPFAEDDQEDTSAWDDAGSSFVPLLWRIPVEEDRAVRTAGASSDPAGAWADEASAARTAAAGRPGGPDPDHVGLTAWRPNRSAASEAGVWPGGGYPGLMCGDADELPDEEEEQEDEAASGAEKAEEERKGRGIADLLVQDGSTWGTAPESHF